MTGRGSRNASVAAAGAFVVAVAPTLARHHIAPLFLDFGSTIFYPARAFLDGASPYDVGPYLARYPADAPFAYPPAVLLLGLPFASLGLRTAETLYLALSLCLLPVLAYLAAAAQDNEPSASIYRIDAIALGSRLAGRNLPAAATLGLTLAILALGCWSARRFDRSPGGGASADAVTCLAVAICGYHQTYDVLLVTAALAALALARHAAERPLLPVATLVLLALPFANHAATYAFVDRLAPGGGPWLLVTCVNGAALLLAFLCYVGRATAS